jgi:hypothetical protein
VVRVADVFLLLVFVGGGVCQRGKGRGWEVVVGDSECGVEAAPIGGGGSDCWAGGFWEGVVDAGEGTMEVASSRDRGSGRSSDIETGGFLAACRFGGFRR